MELGIHSSNHTLPKGWPKFRQRSQFLSSRLVPVITWESQIVAMTKVWSYAFRNANRAFRILKPKILFVSYL